MTQYLVDGQKAVRIDALPDSAWVWFGGKSQDTTEAEYRRAVPWLYRSVELRSNAVASLPFALLTEGGEEFDTSADYQNKIGWLPHPGHLFWLTEAALMCLGRCYHFREYNQAQTTDLKYLLPTTIEPMRNNRTNELEWFERTLPQGRIRLEIDEVVYHWQLDPFVEDGPPEAYPLRAALMAAGVLYNVDQFSALFFERGAVKVSLLEVDGGLGKSDSEQLKKWWRKVVSGISNAWSTRILNRPITVHTIGEGIDALANTDLTAEKREDISTSLGIPQTLLFSNAANYATAKEDRLSFYQETIVPEAKFIASVLNDQVFSLQGLTLVFQPETLDIYQVDENERAQAFSLYVNGGMPLGVAGRMLGLELAPEDSWEQIEKEKEERAAEMAENMANAAPPPGNTQQENENPQKAAMWEDLKLWAKKSKKRGEIAPFESAHIPETLIDTIKAAGDVGVFGFLKELDTLVAERRIKAKMAAILKKHLKRISLVIRENGNVNYQPLIDDLKKVLGPEMAGIATEQALRVAAEVGVQFDPAMVNDAAAAWAREYTFELVDGLTETTHNVVQRSMTSYIETPGMTRAELEALLEPAFGEYRASMIAVTETTRAYSESMNQYQQQIREEAGVTMDRIWNTNADELVCPVCGPLNGQPENQWAESFPSGPPAHVNCRCFLTLRKT